MHPSAIYLVFIFSVFTCSCIPLKTLNNNNIMKTVTCLLIFICVSITSQSQEDPLQKKRKEATLEISVFNRSISMPGYIPEEVHPGFNIGIELPRKEKKFNTRAWQFNVGYYPNVFDEWGIYASADYIIHYNIAKSRCYISPMIGFGILHTFRTRQLYKLDNDGKYVESSELGLPNILLNPGLEISCRFQKTIFDSFFFRYQYLFHGPYGDFTPVLPNQILSAGINLKIKIRRNDKR